MSGNTSLEDLLRGEEGSDFFNNYETSPASSEYSNVSMVLPDNQLKQQSVTIPLDSHKRPADKLLSSNAKSIKVEPGTESQAAPKRPGRKPDVAEPASKRKAQNRAAQRAFRERKEKHLKDLEDRVAELEHETATTNDENEFLKFQVERLQSELKKYRNVNPYSQSTSSSDTSPDDGLALARQASNPNKSSFTFEFPFFQDPQKVSNSPITHKHSFSSNVSSSSGRDGDLSPNESPSHSFSSVTPPSLKGDSPDKTTQKLSPPADKNTDEFCDQLSLACGNKNQPVPKALQSQKTENSPYIHAGVVKWPVSPPVSGGYSASLETLSASKSGKAAGVSPSNTVDLTKEDNSSSSLFSPTSFTTDFLSDYKDPLFDGDAFVLPEITNNEYGMFDPLENPVINSSFDKIAEANKQCGLDLKAPVHADEDEEEIPNNTTKLMSCSDAWDRISSHPKFNDIDIDGLCFELRAKAKCSESGVLLSEKDLDIALEQTVRATQEALTSRRS